MDSFLSLVLNSQRVTLPVGVQVCGSIGEEGWANLAKACIHLQLRDFTADRPFMIEGKRGDLRTIWDSLDNEGKWTVFYDHIDAEVEVWLEWDTEEEKERE